MGFFWGFMGAMILWICSLFAIYLIIVKTRIASLIDVQLSRTVGELMSERQHSHSSFVPAKDSQSTGSTSSFVSPLMSQDYKQELNSKESIDELLSDL